MKIGWGDKSMQITGATLTSVVIGVLLSFGVFWVFSEELKKDHKGIRENQDEIVYQSEVANYLLYKALPENVRKDIPEIGMPKRMREKRMKQDRN